MRGPWVHQYFASLHFDHISAPQTHVNLCTNSTYVHSFDDSFPAKSVNIFIDSRCSRNDPNPEQQVAGNLIGVHRTCCMSRAPAVWEYFSCPRAQQALAVWKYCSTQHFLFFQAKSKGHGKKFYKNGKILSGLKGFCL